MARKIELVEFLDREEYPIEKSAEGTNAFYCDFCNFAGYRPAYASCLNRINNGCVSGLESSCAGAIAQGHCMALGMQKQERQEGKALFYVNRTKIRENQVENAERMGITLGRRVERNLTNAVPTRPSDNVPNGIEHAPVFKTNPTYSDAINKKVRELAKDTAVADASTAKASPSKNVSVESKSIVSGDLRKETAPIKTEGLSLLEIARLRKQQTLNA